MQFNYVLTRRYSCRAFAPRGVEAEKEERILEVGRIAPTQTGLRTKTIAYTATKTVRSQMIARWRR